MSGGTLGSPKRRHLAPLMLWLSFAAFDLLCFDSNAADPEQILKAAREAALAWNSYSCQFKIESALGATMLTGTGTQAWMKPNFIKRETITSSTATGMTRMLEVSDGKIKFTETQGDGSDPPIVFRSAETGGNFSESPSQQLAWLEAFFDLKLDAGSSEDTIEAKTMDVLRGGLRALDSTSKNPSNGKLLTAEDRAMIQGMMASVRVWIGREDHFLHRFELIPPTPAQPKPDPEKAKATQSPQQAKTMPKITTTYLAAKFNPPLTPADFVYTPPAGAKVNDLSPGSN